MRLPGHLLAVGPPTADGAEHEGAGRPHPGTEPVVRAYCGYYRGRKSKAERRAQIAACWLALAEHETAKEAKGDE
ncbi:MAG: hypothetical protein C4551_06265 [Bacillota bacterium]|nr:MAG: hypothetical protein C4551_06265 [Bacillota bacterium]